MPIQVLLHKGLALLGVSVIDEDDREMIIFEDWDLMDLNGETINFKDTEGKVILINFWATWCPPCVAELPSMEALNSDYKSKVTILLVSNEDPEIVKKFMTKKEYELNSHQPLSKYPENFNINSIPRTFLIDKKGMIVIDKKGAANWNSDAIRDQLNTLLLE